MKSIFSFHALLLLVKIAISNEGKTGKGPCSHMLDPTGKGYFDECGVMTDIQMWLGMPMKKLCGMTWNWWGPRVGGPMCETADRLGLTTPVDPFTVNSTVSEFCPEQCCFKHEDCTDYGNSFINCCSSFVRRLNHSKFYFRKMV